MWALQRERGAVDSLHSSPLAGTNCGCMYFLVAPPAATTGALLFRGPRLRMGLTEGVPDSVLPDHTGRTNYTGTDRWTACWLQGLCQWCFDC